MRLESLLEVQKVSAWGLFKDFINSLDNGEVFSRQQLFNYIKHITFATSFGSTYDNYRNVIEKTGFIAKTIKPGIFIKVANIPDKLSFNNIRNVYNKGEKIIKSNSIFDVL